jgi:hypothetical protein
MIAVGEESGRSMRWRAKWRFREQDVNAVDAMFARAAHRPSSACWSADRDRDVPAYLRWARHLIAVTGFVS